MSEKLSDIKSVVIKVETDKPVRKTAYQVKGVFMRQYPDEPIIPMLDGTYRNKFLYPRVQVKVLKEQIYLIGIHEGVEAVLSISKKLSNLDFGNITFEILKSDIEKGQSQFIASNSVLSYQFITPWVALNRMTWKKYRSLSNKKKPSFLNKLLGQNLLFLSNEFHENVKGDIVIKVKVSNLSPIPVAENKWGSFKGGFKTNFLIPNYIGIGNGITRGFGTIHGEFNHSDFLSNEVQLATDLDEVIHEERMEVISISNTKKPKRKNKNFKTNKINNKWKKKKKYKQNVNLASKKHQENNRYKKKLNPGNIKEEDPDLNDEQRFNTEKHHKKQHKF